MEPNKLSREFFEQPTLDVARQLLGKRLVFHGPAGTRIGKIIETEAYVGPDDQASHASRGKTKRTTPMFGPAGYTYVYLIYGMYWCLNIVTERADYPAAVLIRALEVIDPPNDDPRIASGPGKVCRWLSLTIEQNQLDLTGKIAYIETGDSDKQEIVIRPRIGVDYAGAWKDRLMRFYIKDNPSISRP